jgi:hypothetical protein
MHTLLKRVRGALLGSSGTSGAALEALEAREQMAGDLQVTVGTPALRFDQTLHTDRLAVAVTVKNIGDATIRSPFLLSVSLSSDTTVGNDYVIFEQNSGKWLRRNESMSFTVFQSLPFDPIGFGGQPRLAEGTYHVRATLAYSDSSTDASTSNNTAFSTGTIPLSYSFSGATNERYKRSLTMFVSQTQQLTFDLDGPGNGRVVINSSGGLDVTVNNTTSSTKMSVKPTVKRTASSLASLTVRGPLRELDAARVSINGNITFDDNARTIKIASVTGSTWTIGGDLPTAITLGAVTNASLDSSAPISALTATSWLNTDNSTDVIVAPQVTSMVINGDFAPNLLISGSMGSFKSSGAVSGKWDISGSVKSIAIGSTTSAAVINSSDSIATVGISGTHAGILSAPVIKSVTILGSMTGGSIFAGTDLGSDSSFGGAGSGADRFVAGSLLSVRIIGGMTNALIACSLNPKDGQFLNGDDVFGSAQSRIGSIRIDGTTQSSNFFAKVFSGSVFITGNKVNTATDQRFHSSNPVGT